MNTLSSIFRVSDILPENVQQVLELYQGNPLFFKHYPPRPTLETVKEDISRLPKGRSLKDKSYIGFWDEDDLVAVMDFIYAYPNEETVFIGFFMLNKAYQGRGIGSQIIQEATDYFSKTFKKVRLAYVKTNPQAKHFWKKQGFLSTGIEVKEELYTLVISERELS